MKFQYKKKLKHQKPPIILHSSTKKIEVGGSCEECPFSTDDCCGSAGHCNLYDRSIKAFIREDEEGNVTKLKHCDASCVYIED